MKENTLGAEYIDRYEGIRCWGRYCRPATAYDILETEGQHFYGRDGIMNDLIDNALGVHWPTFDPDNYRYAYEEPKFDEHFQMRIFRSDGKLWFEVTPLI